MDSCGDAGRRTAVSSTKRYTGTWNGAAPASLSSGKTQASPDELEEVSEEKAMQIVEAFRAGGPY